MTENSICVQKRAAGWWVLLWKCTLCWHFMWDIAVHVIFNHVFSMSQLFSWQGKTKDLDDQIANLNEELLNTETKIIASLSNPVFSSMRRILENQKELFKQKLEDMQAKLEEIRETLESVDDLKENQRLLNTKWRLERRAVELERLHLDTENMIHTITAENVKRLTDMIMGLKKDMMQLHEQVEQKKIRVSSFSFSFSKVNKA